MENGEMLIRKQSCFRHILLSICLILILIAGTGLASAAVELATPNQPVVRWVNEDTFLDQSLGLHFTLEREPGSFRVYIIEDERQLGERTYQIGVINSPQTLTGEPCSRPPLIDQRSKNVCFDNEGCGANTGATEVHGYGDTFRAFVPNGEDYPSQGVDVPFDGRHYYAEVRVPPVVGPDGWIELPDGRFVFPVEFSTRDFWPDGSRPHEFSPPTITPGEYTIHVQVRGDPSDSTAGVVEIKPGDVDIQLSIAGRPITQPVYPGEIITINGNNTDSPFTFIWLTGGDLPLCGVGIPVRDAPHVLQNGDGRTSNPLIIENVNGRIMDGRIPATTWDSGRFPQAAGQYRIVVSSQNVGTEERWGCNIACPEPGVCGLENCPTCEVRGDLDIIFRPPTLEVDLDEIIDRCCCDGFPCGILGGDSPILLEGNTGGSRQFRVWLFGEGMVGPLKYFTAIGHADNTGKFVFDINHDMVREEGVNICEFAPGEYTVIVQVPGFNQEFDVEPGPWESGRQYVVSSQPIPWTRNFQVDGPGSLVGIPASSALLAAFPPNAPLIDDQFVVKKFRFNDVTASGLVDFSATPTAGNSPLTVEFTDQTGFLVESWSWSFGDVSPVSTEQHPVHVYEKPGTYSVTLIATGAKGQQKQLTKTSYITVISPPNTGFTIRPELAYVGESVQFTDQSVPKPLTYLWDFGDGTTSPLESPVHAYAEQGIYTVTLTTSNQYGIGEPRTGRVIVANVPIANFTGSPTETAGYPASISFTDFSTEEPNRWLWEFTEPNTGVALTSSEQNPVMIFNEPGTYTVTLTACNFYPEGRCNSEVKAGYITIGPENLTEVSFIAAPDRGIAPLEVQFTSIFAPDFRPNRLTWDFGDGSDNVIWVCTDDRCDFDPSNNSLLDSKRNPKHTYREPGTYTVTLTAENGLVTRSYSSQITVGAGPFADFRMNLAEDGKLVPDEGKVGPAPVVINFTDLSDPNNGRITGWDWKFINDSDEVIGSSGLQNPLFAFTSPGAYKISLAVSNEYGQSSNPEIKRIQVVNDRPVADFYPTDSAMNPNPVRYFERHPAPVFFIDTSPTYPPIDTWSWSFELEGQIIGTSAEQSPVMVFDKPGAYNITLIVSNDGGSSVPAIDTVTVGTERGRVSFTADPMRGLAPLEVQFTDTSDPEFKSLTWDFGDGSPTVRWECMDGCAIDPTDPQRHPKHTYQSAGIFTVTLTGSNGLITDSYSLGIIVGDAPDVDFRITRLDGSPVRPEVDMVRIQETVRFIIDEKDWGPTTSWSWNFGDGGTSALQSPEYSYNDAGLWPVSLIVSNEYGQSATVTHRIWVANDLPVASFYATPSSSPKNPVRVFFTDTSTGYIETWNWAFELEGQVIGNSAEQNPVTIFDKPGTYNITLVVSNDGGSSVPATGTVTVGHERAKVFFEADPLWGPEPLTVQFTDRSDPELKPKTLTWDFGDGETLVWECMDGCALDPRDPVRNPSHTYQNAGRYVVTLTADDGLAIYVSEPVTITVGSAPRADFRMSKDVASIGEKILFTDLSTGDPDSWQWDFGDGSWSSLRSPVHSYSQAGTYDITLTVGNRYTSSLSVTKSILITENAPTEADVDFVCNPLKSSFLPASIQCTDKSNKNVVITSWYWEFIRDGILVWCSSEQNPIATINEPGIYDVKLTIGNNGGEASLTKEKYVVVGEGNSVIVYPGWNHVAVPVELANGFNTMADVFAGIQTGAWPYSIYSQEIQDWSEVEDDYIVKPLELVRVNSAEPGPVESTFVFATLQGTYWAPLQPGWNGIGISAWQPIIASVALASLEDKWDRVIGYDASLQVWEEPIYRTINADVKYMHPGMGYLILMDEEAVFTNGVKL